MENFGAKVLEVSYLIKMTVDSSHRQKNTACSFLLFLKFLSYFSFSRPFCVKSVQENNEINSIKLGSRKCVRHVLKRSLLQRHEIYFLKVQCNTFTA